MPAHSFFRPGPLPLAPATFIGMQDGFGGQPPIELFTLDARVGDHPVGSTVSRKTLESHGYVVPGGSPVGRFFGRATVFGRG